MEDLIPILIQLAAGMLGGIVTGQTLRGYSLGVLVNAFAGILGGILCALVLARSSLIETGPGPISIILAFALLTCGFIAGALIMSASGALNRKFGR